MTLIHDKIRDFLAEFVHRIAILPPADQILLIVVLLVAGSCATCLGKYKDGRKARLAAIEFKEFCDEIRSRDKAVDMDCAIRICKGLAEIEAKHGVKNTVQVLVVDGRGIPARLTLTAN